MFWVHRSDWNDIRERKLTETIWQQSYGSLISRGDLTPDEGGLFRNALSDPLAINGGMNWYRANMPAISEITDATYWPTEHLPIRVPVLLVWGEADRTFVPEFMNEIKHYAPESEIFRLPGINHWTSMEQPQAANKEIERFLSQHISSSRQ